MPITPDATTAKAAGYVRLADYMAWNPNNAIFPRLRAANHLNLLGLQAQVEYLYEDLTDSIAAIEGPGIVDWRKVIDNQDGQPETWQKMLQLRTTLQLYNEALLQQAELSKVPCPAKRDLNLLHEYLVDDQLLNTLRGPGSGAWSTKDEKDEHQLRDKLVPSSNYDLSDKATIALSSLLEKFPNLLASMPSVARRSFPLQPGNAEGLTEFELYSSLARVRGVINTGLSILASLMTTIPIIILNFYPGINGRLGLIVLFTAAFTGLLAWLSEARRSELFAASAAFAAVQVIFVGSVTSTGSISG